MIIFAYTFNPLFIHIHILDHIIPLSCFLFLLLLNVLEQCSYFNVNSSYADVSLNPPLLFHTAFPQNPWGKKKKIRETCICLWSLSATQYVLSRLVKGNTFFLMGHKNSPFPAVWELYSHLILHLWCMEKAHGSPSPLQSAASNPNCPKAAPVTTDIITHFLSVRLPLWIPLHASMKSTFIPLWKNISTRCRPSWSLGGCAGMSVHSWTPFFFFFHQTRMCAHIWANPLISPPGLLSISDGSRAVGDDDCWQDLDYWGEDDGSSCSDRIAVTPDPLEGLIRLLWKLLLLDLQQPGRYS